MGAICFRLGRARERRSRGRITRARSSMSCALECPGSDRPRLAQRSRTVESGRGGDAMRVVQSSDWRDEVPFDVPTPAAEAAPGEPTRCFVCGAGRSEEHTSELQVTNAHRVCRLLLEKKK